MAADNLPVVARNVVFGVNFPNDQVIVITPKEEPKIYNEQMTVDNGGRGPEDPGENPINVMCVVSLLNRRVIYRYTRKYILEKNHTSVTCVIKLS